LYFYVITTQALNAPGCVLALSPLDIRTNARQLSFMNFDRFAGLFAASAICLTLAIATWTGVFGPIWRATYTATPDQWLGFFGSVIGAVLAALIALFAAYKTLSPMRAQLDQLIKQNDHVLYERMRRRAADLNEETILIERVCGDCALVDREAEEFLKGGAVVINPAAARLKVAVARFTDSVNNIQKARGEIWGDVRIQAERNAFIDQALMAGTLAGGWVTFLETQLAKTVIDREISKWRQHRIAVASLGGPLHAKAQHEMRRAAFIISGLESRLFTGME
jgi:hypothetical protein